jgi:hypothetical protein
MSRKDATPMILPQKASKVRTKALGEARQEGPTTATKKRGWDEIESLFDTGKQSRKKQQEELAALAIAEKKKSEQRRQQHPRNNRGSISSNGVEWMDDGLGGVYNAEGYTGRVVDGVKVFKMHVLRQNANAGQSSDCPFDCNCCFI